MYHPFKLPLGILEILLSLPLWINPSLASYCNFYCTNFEMSSTVFQLHWKCSSKQQFILLLICCGYGNYKREQHLRSSFSSVAIFSTASEAFSPQRKERNIAKTASRSQIPTASSHFCCFNVFHPRPPQKFQVQAKILAIWCLFPDYFSISYDDDKTCIKTLQNYKIL